MNEELNSAMKAAQAIWDKEYAEMFGKIPRNLIFGMAFTAFDLSFGDDDIYTFTETMAAIDNFVMLDNDEFLKHFRNNGVDLEEGKTYFTTHSKFIGLYMTKCDGDTNPLERVQDVVITPISRMNESEKRDTPFEVKIEQIPVTAINMQFIGTKDEDEVLHSTVFHFSYNLEEPASIYVNDVTQGGLHLKGVNSILGLSRMDSISLYKLFESLSVGYPKDRFQIPSVYICMGSEDEKYVMDFVNYISKLEEGSENGV